MADRWRDDDRYDRGYRGSSASDDRRDLGRPRSDYSDYDRDFGRDERAGDRYGQDRYHQGDRSAYSRWGRPDDAREFDDYTRAPSGRNLYDRGTGYDRGQSQQRYGTGYGYEGVRYGASDSDRLSRGYGAPRTYGPTGGYGYGAYDERQGGPRGRLDGLRGFREGGYDFDEDGDRGARDYQSYRADYRDARDERGWMERAGDEVRSWFGDEDAERRRRQDQYRGHGPKGYTRSDERIREDVNDRLSDDSRVNATEIDVKVASGEVTLSGTVQDRLQKRRAEDIAEAVSGVRHVQNNLRVQTASSTLGTTSASNLSPGAATPPQVDPTTGAMKTKP